jgi:hypothetical protein
MRTRYQLRVPVVIALALIAACKSSERDSKRDQSVALAAAQDTASKQWKHEVGVDSIQMRGDTSVVWVSPRNWQATDAPQAVVRVLDGRIVVVHWIMGG